MESHAKLATATFAGGCFWCMEPPFEKLSGVISVEPGYMGGKIENPTYQQVASGGTGHAEVVQVIFNEEKISYQALVETFFKGHDPTDAGGQFVDRGDQYRSAIFYKDDNQKKVSQKFISQLTEAKIFQKEIVTSLEKVGSFTQAEDYHRDYYKKNPEGYKQYRINSGRDQFLQRVWADRRIKQQQKYNRKYSQAELKSKLTPLQYKITQQDGTEAPFQNMYWNNKRAGIYVDVVTGRPLFSSTDKFKSGTGWPSFTKPITSESVITKKDGKLFRTRTEVRSPNGNSHLGHVFDDGPAPTGMRYCINSAALRFVPLENLKDEGLEHLVKIFTNNQGK